MAIANNAFIKNSSNLQQTKIVKNQQNQKISPNGVDKTPNEDTVQLNNGKKVGIGVGIVATAFALICLLKCKLNPKSAELKMTEKAKKIYDNIASKLSRKNEITSEIIDKNLASKEKEGVWKIEDMKEYYTQLEKETVIDKLKNKHGIVPLESEEEYTTTLERLKQIYKRDRDNSGRIYDTRSGGNTRDFILGFDETRDCPNKLQGLIPYCGINDISRDINVYLNNERNGLCKVLKEKSYVYTHDLDVTQLIDIDPTMAKDYIRCLDYSLAELDQLFGKYEGLVYRGGLFNPHGHQFYSTSDRCCRTQINCQRGQENLQFHIIKTKNGHKILEFQKRYGKQHFAENESEVLLPRDTEYRDITNTGQFEAEKQEMAKKLYQDLCEKYTLKEILSKIKIWEEI